MPHPVYMYVGLCVIMKAYDGEQIELHLGYHCKFNSCCLKFFSQYRSSRKSPIMVHSTQFHWRMGKNNHCTNYKPCTWCDNRVMPQSCSLNENLGAPMSGFEVYAQHISGA